MTVTNKLYTQYDHRGRIQSQLSYQTEQQGLIGQRYEYDIVGNLRQVNRQTAESNSYQQYEYDSMGRMLGRSDPAGGQSERFVYDAADNLIEAKHSGYEDNALLNDLLTQFKNHHYQYDGFGQLIHKRDGALEQHFIYDDEGHLIHAKGDGPMGQHETAYQYDAIGRRVSKTVTYRRSTGQKESKYTRFIWQGLRMTQVIQDNRQIQM